MSEVIAVIANVLLRDSAAAHRRRCAVRLGVRETDQKNCRHSNWDEAKCWCNDCGVTLSELLVDGAARMSASS